MLQEAKAMSHYNKPQGLEAALHAELSAKRQKLSDNQPVNLAQVSALPSPVMTAGSTLLSQKTKCSYNLTSSTKCGGVCVPLSKFCIKHIMNDTTQARKTVSPSLFPMQVLGIIFSKSRCCFARAGWALSPKMSLQKTDPVRPLLYLSSGQALAFITPTFQGHFLHWKRYTNNFLCNQFRDYIHHCFTS